MPWVLAMHLKLCDHPVHISKGQPVSPKPVIVMACTSTARFDLRRCCLLQLHRNTQNTQKYTKSCLPSSQYTHLPTALWPSTNANGWYVERLRHSCCNGCWDAFQHDGKAAAVLQGLCLVDHTHRLAGYLSLGPETTCAHATASTYTPDHQSMHGRISRDRRGTCCFLTARTQTDQEPMA